MTSRQDFFDREYTQAKSEGFSSEESFNIASKLLKNFRPTSKKASRITGKKSLALSSSLGSISSDNIIRDVVFGGIKAGIEELSGGLALDESGWKRDYKELIGDIGHFNFDLKQGNPNDLEPDYQHFTEKATNFRFINGELLADIELPDLMVSNDIKNKYYNREIGVSIEYEGNEENGVVKDWNITGFTLHKDPDFDTKLK